MTTENSNAIEQLKAENELLLLQVERTRDINAELWKRVSEGARFRNADGKLSVLKSPDQPEETAASIKAITALEHELASLRDANQELWKRVAYAESVAAIPVRRFVGRVLRKLGLR